MFKYPEYVGLNDKDLIDRREQVEISIYPDKKDRVDFIENEIALRGGKYVIERQRNAS